MKTTCATRGMTDSYNMDPVAHKHLKKMEPAVIIDTISDHCNSALIFIYL